MEKIENTIFEGICVESPRVRAVWSSFCDDELSGRKFDDILYIKETENGMFALVKDNTKIIKEGEEKKYKRTCDYCGCIYEVGRMDITGARVIHEMGRKPRLFGTTRCPWCRALYDGDMEEDSAVCRD